MLVNIEQDTLRNAAENSTLSKFNLFHVNSAQYPRNVSSSSSWWLPPVKGNYRHSYIEQAASNNRNGVVIQNKGRAGCG
jgi:nitric oxide synthase oxygenase domain/subunit